MTHPSSAPTIIAILGTEALAEDILARLLEREGYTIRHLEAPPTGPIEGLLDGVDILLLAPGLKDDAREAFLEAMSTNPKTAAIPVLPLSSALKLSLLDELSAGAPWQSLFEELTSQIGAALARAAESAGAFVVVCCCGAEHPQLPRPMPSRESQRGEPSLPPGYHLDRSDPEGAPVARFSASGYLPKSIEQEAWEDHGRRNGGKPPSYLPPR